MPVTEEVETFLEHFGKKGMKWGVRKRATASGPATSAPAKLHVKSLSNEELRKHIERMNLEKQYTSLANPKKGHSEAKEFAKGLGKTAVSMAATAVISQQIGKILKTSAKVAK